jgi:hypothetical protein
MQINSDWEKPRRFALRIFSAGYLRRERDIRERAGQLSDFMLPLKRCCFAG